MAQSNIKAYTASAVAGKLSVLALAQDNQGANNQGHPVLLIGGGIYWIVRRKKGRARLE